jgi:hypothetical protein
MVGLRQGYVPSSFVSVEVTDVIVEEVSGGLQFELLYADYFILIVETKNK